MKGHWVDFVLCNADTERVCNVSGTCIILFGSSLWQVHDVTFGHGLMTLDVNCK